MTVVITRGSECLSDDLAASPVKKGGLLWWLPGNTVWSKEGAEAKSSGQGYILALEL